MLLECGTKQTLATTCLSYLMMISNFLHSVGPEYQVAGVAVEQPHYGCKQPFCRAII